MSDDRLSLIADYLSGELSPKEEAEFLKKCEQDPELKAALDASAEAVSLAKLAGRLELQQSLQEIAQQHKRQAKVVRLKFLIPAAAIIALLLGTYFWSGPSTGDTQALFEQNFEIYPAPANQRSSDLELINWNAAVEAYNEQDYELSLQFLEKAASEKPAYIIAFYKAQCLMATKNYEAGKLMMILEGLAGHNTPYSEQALWYLGLYHLSVESIDVAKVIFQDIVDANAYKAVEAAEILKQLE